MQATPEIQRVASDTSQITDSPCTPHIQRADLRNGVDMSPLKASETSFSALWISRLRARNAREKAVMDVCNEAVAARGQGHSGGGAPSGTLALPSGHLHDKKVDSRHDVFAQGVAPHVLPRMSSLLEANGRRLQQYKDELLAPGIAAMVARHLHSAAATEATSKATALMARDADDASNSGGNGGDSDSERSDLPTLRDLVNTFAGFIAMILTNGEAQRSGGRGVAAGGSVHPNQQEVGARLDRQRVDGVGIDHNGSNHGSVPLDIVRFNSLVSAFESVLIEVSFGAAKGSALAPNNNNGDNAGGGKLSSLEPDNPVDYGMLQLVRCEVSQEFLELHERLFRTEVSLAVKHDEVVKGYSKVAAANKEGFALRQQLLRERGRMVDAQREERRLQGLIGSLRDENTVLMRLTKEQGHDLSMVRNLEEYNRKLLEDNAAVNAALEGQARELQLALVDADAKTSEVEKLRAAVARSESELEASKECYHQVLAMQAHTIEMLHHRVGSMSPTASEDGRGGGGGGVHAGFAGVSGADSINVTPANAPLASIAPGSGTYNPYANANKDNLQQQLQQSAAAAASVGMGISSALTTGGGPSHLSLNTGNDGDGTGTAIGVAGSGQNYPLSGGEVHVVQGYMRQAASAGTVGTAMGARPDILLSLQDENDQSLQAGQQGQPLASNASTAATNRRSMKLNPDEVEQALEFGGAGDAGAGAGDENHSGNGALDSQGRPTKPQRDLLLC